METTRKLLIIALMLFFVATVQAETITIFDSNATISDGNTYDTVVVKGDGTVVDMTGGNANKVIVMNASTFNLSGGNINNQINSYDLSILNLSGGSASQLFCYGQSNVNITGNASTGLGRVYQSTVVTISSHTASVTDLYFQHHSTLHLLAGSVAGNIESAHYATLNIDGGSVSGEIRAYDWWATTRKINISDGTIGAIDTGGDGEGATIWRLSGGAIDEISGDNWGNYEINIIGYDLEAIPYGGGLGYGQVSGYWNDDTYFSIDLDAYDVYSHIVLYDGTLPPDPLPPLQDQITALQQTVDENRDALEQFTPLRKLLEELSLTIQKEHQ